MSRADAAEQILDLELRNTTDTDWINLGGDSTNVVVIPADGYYLDAGEDTLLPTLAPGDAVMLNGRLTAPLDPGTYQTHAELADLNLTTNTTTPLTITN